MTDAPLGKFAHTKEPGGPSVSSIISVLDKGSNLKEQVERNLLFIVLSFDKNKEKKETFERRMNEFLIVIGERWSLHLHTMQVTNCLTEL